MLRRRLERAGYRVREAVDGRQAVDEVERACPDLVLMDLELPGMDGWEATRRIRAGAVGRRLPIIAVSAHAMRRDLDAALAAGCDACAAKPVELETLLQRVESLLRGARTGVGAG
ncbi:response regulator [Myxococcota bacterium]|nr:response regulator [Myxococcota bacterium]